MTAPKILNLASIAPAVSRQVEINGKVCELREATVEDFVFINELAQKDTTNVIEQMEDSLKILTRMVEGVTVEELRQLTMVQLAALRAFVNGMSIQEVLDAGIKTYAENNPDREVGVQDATPEGESQAGN